MGSGYVIDHCMTAIKKEAKENAYKEYIADCNRFVSYSTAVLASILSNGKAETSYIKKPFRDMMQDAEKPQDDRTSNEIINSFLDYFGEKENQAGNPA